MNQGFEKALTRVAIAATMSISLSGYAQAKEFYLCADEVVKTMPDGVAITMWGLKEDDDDDLTNGCPAGAPALVPGPRLTLPPGATTLRINLRNDLDPAPAGAEIRNVSLILPALGRPEATHGGLAPETGLPAPFSDRVTSLVPSIPPGGVGWYRWTHVPPGTYLYQSGTHMAVQVQMGLYGAMTKNARKNRPYRDAGCNLSKGKKKKKKKKGHCQEALLVFSEIDPVLHETVVSGHYGDGSLSYATSTIDYDPKYFLINGDPYPNAQPLLSRDSLKKKDTLWLRFVNAGSMPHIPALQRSSPKKVVGDKNAMMIFHAEDGHVYPNPKEQSSVLLAPGQTKDAHLRVVSTDKDAGEIVIYDRGLDLTNAGSPDGGMMVRLPVGKHGGPPPSSTVAVDDYYTTTEGTTAYNVGPSEGVLVNDDPDVPGALPISGPATFASTAGGTVVLFYDGAFQYTPPNSDFAGTDSFQYRADGGGNVATVRIEVANVNDAPVALNDGPFSVVEGNSININVLGNDYDADGDALSVTLVGTPGGVTLESDGSLTFVATAGTTPVVFSYEVSDGSGLPPATATVTVDVIPGAGPTLTVVGPDGTPIGTGFRWVLEEDRMFRPALDQRDIDNSLSLAFHRSYMPVVASGDAPSSSATLPALDPGKHYHVSVLPKDGYEMGGAAIEPGRSSVEVLVEPQPQPLAQMSIFVFEDTAPVNGAPDLPEERGLEGFQVILEDAAGRYGVAGGHLTMDAFGNPLGTTYCRDDSDYTPGGECEGKAVGDVNVLGPTFLLTDANGRVNIKNLPPGKYGVQVIPPAGETTWQQTSTIEGTKVIDAWVKQNEPPFFAEFGPPGFHVFVGFVKPTELTLPPPPAGGSSATLSGKVTNVHAARPPDVGFYSGLPQPATTAWVGLNDLAVGTGNMVYAQRASEDGSFSISGVPDGNYQLVIWDDYLDVIIAFAGVQVLGGTCVSGVPPTPLPTGCNFEDIPVFRWFTRLENQVFEDTDEDGFWDDGEVAADRSNTLFEQPTAIRFRDGSVYQFFPTDVDGFVPYDQVFPFFHWQIMEVGYDRFKATGATVVVDAGGDPFATASPWSFGGLLNPQEQPDNAGAPFRIDSSADGTVLLEAFQGFIGHTSVIHWGKKPWPDVNGTPTGGIAGIVYYAVTRAENAPRLAAAEEWEPGIPGVTVRLYDETGTVLLNEVTTDSWDENNPTGCVWDRPFAVDDGTGTKRELDCFDGLRAYNQVRPGVFDGGYAFETYCPGGWFPGCEEQPLVVGTYVVEVVVPPGYELVKEEDKNVDFGREYDPESQSGLQGDALYTWLETYYPWAQGGIFVPKCVGGPHEVPPELDLFPGVPAPWAGQIRPLCDRKRIELRAGMNFGVADFYLFTKTPIASHIVGFLQNDLSNEFDPNAPNFGEKFAPSWLPVSIRDWTGREIQRVYTDEWGKFNALVPATFSANLLIPSGMSPNMLITCMNDAGPIRDTDPGSATFGQLIQDPHYQPQYSQFCYTFQYMPGTTTYLDTPVLPVAAFADQQLDCQFPAGTPRIFSVAHDAAGTGGPWFPTPTGSAQKLYIRSMGDVDVPNPAYTGVLGTEPRLVTRDYGFGPGGTSQGTVTLGGTPLNVLQWTSDHIEAEMPTGLSPGQYQLEITRGDNGESTIVGITVHVTAPGNPPVYVSAGESIQAAIDAANPGDLILVEPGVYEEMLVLWKKVRLQGFGAGSVTLHAGNKPAEKIQAWKDHVSALVAAGEIDLLPGQGIGVDPVAVEQGVFLNELTPGILVAGKSNDFRASGVDGFTITGAQNGGGIIVNGFVRRFDITNNEIQNNSGFYHGGIRVGSPVLTTEGPDGTTIYTDARNDRVNIHHNSIHENGGFGGAGAGVSICTGADNYRVTENWICGNFTTGDGGGIGHLGLSRNGLIASNTILYNQTFNQGRPRSGGGIYIAGQAPIGCPVADPNCAAPALALSPGSGSVSVRENLIQGNQAGAGDGGGVRLERVNGQDVAASPNVRSRWYRISLFNNMIVNNMAGEAGGGISLQDAARTRIIFSTVANNDSTATAGGAFTPGQPNRSSPQPAGIVSHAHSDELSRFIGTSPAVKRFNVFSNPWPLRHNVLWHNRSFHVEIANPGVRDYVPTLVPNLDAGDTPIYNDLAVLGAVGQMDPRWSVLSDTTGYHPSNIQGDPMFVDEYTNANRQSVVIGEPTTGLSVAIAFDEGGNFIDVRYSPLTLQGDYHLGAASPAVDSGRPAGERAVSIDIDGEARPQGARVDRGADEVKP